MKPWFFKVILTILLIPAICFLSSCTMLKAASALIGGGTSNDRSINTEANLAARDNNKALISSKKESRLDLNNSSNGKVVGNLSISDGGDYLYGLLILCIVLLAIRRPAINGTKYLFKYFVSNRQKK